MGFGSEIRDPGSGKKPILVPDPVLGVKKAPDPGSGSAALSVVHLFSYLCCSN
jgi:hypothetical protein